MKMYDTIKTCSTPEEARKEFETAMKQWETERAKAAAAEAKTAYASRLTQIANRMLNHSETAEDAAFVLNTYLTDKHVGYCVTAEELNSTVKWIKTFEDFSNKVTSHSDDETISKFLNDILGL